MITKMFLAGFLLVTQIKTREEIPSAVRAEIGTLHGLPYEERLERLNGYDDADRDALLEWAKIWVDVRDRSSTPDDSYYDKFLFHLGDEETLAKGAALFAQQKYSWAQVFIHGRNPQVIPALAPIMANDDLTRATNDQTAPAYAATETIVMVLQRAPQFSPAVRAWAQDAEAMGDSDQQRAIMRDWWQENQNHFERRDYAAVQPGRTAVANVKDSAPPPAFQKGVLEPMGKPSSAEPPLVTIHPAKRRSYRFEVVAGVAAVAGLIGLLFFWRRRVHG